MVINAQVLCKLNNKSPAAKSADARIVRVQGI